MRSLRLTLLLLAVLTLHATAQIATPPPLETPPPMPTIAPIQMGGAIGSTPAPTVQKGVMGPMPSPSGRKSGSAEEDWHHHGFPLEPCSIIIRATCWPPSVTMGMPAPGFTLPPTKNKLWN